MSRTSRKSFSSVHPALPSTLASQASPFKHDAGAPPLQGLDQENIQALARKGSTASSIYTSATSTSSPETLEDSYVTPNSDDDRNQSVVPKIEELDEDSLNDIAGIKEDPQAPNGSELAVRRRGRPRKLPVPDCRRSSHARSKTGCLTCRKRKKKCDEARPCCENCRKNNVFCEGYEPKQPWRSGGERGVEKRRASVLAPMDLPMLFDGVDGKTDQLFFEHFVSKLSVVLPLTIAGDQSNPWLSIILPMATSNRGIMHSLLSVSASWLVNRCTDSQIHWQERQAFHHSSAIALLTKDIDRVMNAPVGNVTAQTIEPVILQSLLLCVQTVCAGDSSGSYKYHLGAMKSILTQHRSQFVNNRLRQFCYDFLIYNNVSSLITSCQSTLDQHSSDLMGPTGLPSFSVQPEPSMVVGVGDGLFDFVSSIRLIRDRVRVRRESGSNTWWDGPITSEAIALDRALRDWTSPHPSGSSQYILSLLYRQCIWIYLHRTTQLSRSHDTLKQAVDQALHYLGSLPLQDADDDGSQSMLLMPLFLLGCAAFDADQRPPINALLHKLQEWSGMGNISYVRAIVEDIWTLMDNGKEAESWDWEGLIAARKWDILVS